MTATGVQLDESQAQVVNALADARRIVSAGPGAGKTEVVGHLIEHLVQDGLYPEEILLISFSRAAVDVLLQRTAGVADQGRGVDIATIDSLAARIVVELSDDEPQFRGFDKTVFQAVDLLRSTDEHPLGGIRHVVVDEVQDVVGIRADFVLEILTSAASGAAGFTLLGDALQSVYDFQLGDHPMTSGRFLDEVRRRFGPDDLHLTGEYRTSANDTRSAALARISLLDLSSTARLHRLSALVADVPTLGELDGDAIEDIAAWPGRTALLCDTNIRAALVAQRANGLGLPVELAAARADPGVASWIGDLLQKCSGATCSRTDFMQLAEAKGLEVADERWRLLLLVTQGRRELSLRALGEALRSPRVPRELERGAQTNVIASTVHRAKGLEFDNVVVVDPAAWDRMGPEDPNGQAAQDDASSRRLFVALTRARSRLAQVRAVDTKDWWKERAVDGSVVWVRKAPRRGYRGPTTGILLEPWMARALGPSTGLPDLAIGTPLTWGRGEDLVTVDGQNVPSWNASAEGVLVARTGEVFGQFVSRTAGSRTMPALSLHGGRSDGTETVIGSARTGAGRNGFWTGSRISGPLTLHCNDELAEAGV